MDKNERKKQEEKIDYMISTPDYGELIIDMVHNINDSWILEQIYRCIKNIVKEG